MTPVKKKSKSEAASSGDSTVELGPLTQASNSTKRNLEQPMASDAKRFKRSDASSDISHLTASTGKQPKAMHTTASTTESKFHYLDSPFSSDDDEGLPSMSFVKPSKSSSTKTAFQQEEYVAKVKEAADQEFDKWKQQQEVQAASKASPLAASAASNSRDNSDQFSHPIIDNTLRHSSSIEEQANSASQSTKSQPQLDFTNLNFDSDHQNEANNDDQVPNKSTVSAAYSDDLSATSDGDEMPELTSAHSTPAVSTSTRISLAKKNNTMVYKCQFFFTENDNQFFCRLLVNNKKSPKYGKQCPYSISSTDPKLLTNSIGHLYGAHDLRTSDVQGDEYVQVINTFAKNHRVTIDFTGPLPVGTVQEAARAQEQRRFQMATAADSSFEIENLTSVRQQNQVFISTLASTHPEPEHKDKATIFGRTFTIYKPQPPNRSLSADTELTIYSMFHHSLLYLVNSPEYLETALNEIEQFDTAIQAEAEAKFCMDPTNSELLLNMSFSNCTTYIHLSMAESTHPLELLNHTFYGGKTDDFMWRQDQHLDAASRMYLASSYQAVITQNPNLYKHIAEGWKNEIPFYMLDMSLAKKSPASAAFHEHIVIKCLMSSPLCKNGNHGSTTPFKALLRQKNLNMDKRAKYGLAELIACYQEVNFEKDRPLDVLAGSASRSIKACDFLKEVVKRRNAVKQPVQTAYSLANQTVIPNFSLVDGSGELKYLFRYAVYLFTSIFTIPPKLALWYLHREGSIDRLNQVDNDDRRQDYLMSISAIIVDYPVTLVDCIKWARQLFTLLFDTNVQLANVQRAALGLSKLYPISIDDVRGTKQIENFIIAAARLRAQLYDLKDENEDAPSVETLKNALFIYLGNLTEPEQVLFSDRFNEAKPYRKITHFTKLADVCSLPLPKDLIQLEDPQFDPEYLRTHLSITPVEPYMDDDLAFDFIKSAYRLRFFNLQNRFTEDQHTDEGMLLRTDFPVPYFRQASLFSQFL